MNHIQRHLTPEEWERYDQIIAPMKALAYDFLPNEVCAKPFISPQLVNPKVMIVGYNPGAKGTNSTVWHDPHDSNKYKWANTELLHPTDKFLKLFRRCFLTEDWNELVQPHQIDLVWTNLYPFHTPELKSLNDLFDDFSKKGMHPRKVCRETMVKLILEVFQPTLIICAGKEIARELHHGFNKIMGKYNTIPSLRELTKGVAYCQIGGIHLVGFSRITSVGFWYDHRNHNHNQEECLQSLTHNILAANH